MPYLIECAEADATLGETVDVMREVFGSVCGAVDSVVDRTCNTGRFKGPAPKEQRRYMDMLKRD